MFSNFAGRKRQKSRNTSLKNGGMHLPKDGPPSYAPSIGRIRCQFHRENLRTFILVVWIGTDDGFTQVPRPEPVNCSGIVSYMGVKGSLVRSWLGLRGSTRTIKVK